MNNETQDFDPQLAERFAAIAELDAPDLWGRIERDAATDPSQPTNLARGSDDSNRMRRLVAAVAACLLLAGGLWFASGLQGQDQSVSTSVAAPGSSDGPSDEATVTSTPVQAPTPTRPPPSAAIGNGPDPARFVGAALLPTLRQLGFDLTDEEAACMSANAPTSPPEQVKPMLRSLVDRCLGPGGSLRLVDALFGGQLTAMIGPGVMTTGEVSCLIDAADFDQGQLEAIGSCGLLGRLVSGAMVTFTDDTVACMDREGSENPPVEPVGDSYGMDPVVPYVLACGTVEEVAAYRSFINGDGPVIEIVDDPVRFVGDDLVPTLNTIGFGLSDDEATCMNANAPATPPDPLKEALRSLVDQCLGPEGPELLANAMFGVPLDLVLRPYQLAPDEIDCIIDRADFGRLQSYAMSACGLLGHAIFGTMPGISDDTMTCIDDEGAATPLYATEEGVFEDDELLPYLEACGTAEEIEFFLHGS